MQSADSLITQIKQDYPKFAYSKGKRAHWSPNSNTVFYNPNEDQARAIILHELAHALLGHRQYFSDIELLAIERDAWEYAKNTLAPKYKIDIPQDIIEDHLDSYRDWLHQKSSCPNCGLTGIEHPKQHYSCLACGSKWQVNEARSCHVRRTKK